MKNAILTIFFISTLNLNCMEFSDQTASLLHTLLLNKLYNQIDDLEKSLSEDLEHSTTSNTNSSSSYKSILSESGLNDSLTLLNINQQIKSIDTRLNNVENLLTKILNKLEQK